ncbi:hypothetical protein LIER_27102 [Lithospermum erythrorhizon]|uniref:C2H2-type domain-containing protein n=1 Tax=Lithospermum erythrorhizon TaxID=34254 RepID=A0AAV3RE34_LITER
MDINSMIDEIVTIGSKDHHQSMIMKGKRTKRPRQPSPVRAVFTASSCSSGGDGGGGGVGRKMHTKIRSSESLCSEIISTSTEEDEDMANCLILLAQSGRENKIISTTININNKSEKQEGGEMKLEKTSSKKFKEMTTSSTTIGGKAGIFVYECKTCDRSFPSFQALGGHRTSHKKHKPTVEIMEDKKGKKLPPLDDHHHQENKQDEEKTKEFLKISPSSLLSLEIPKKSSHHRSVINGTNNKVKIHECSICGAEFSSGQALGGHMRRHRIPTSTTPPTTVSSHDDGGERPRNILELDLNLPAPPEDDHHDSQLQFSLLFSSPSLVDCKY